jgi:hypothetical protein
VVGRTPLDSRTRRLGKSLGKRLGKRRHGGSADGKWCWPHPPRDAHDLKRHCVDVSMLQDGLKMVELGGGTRRVDGHPVDRHHHVIVRRPVGFGGLRSPMTRLDRAIAPHRDAPNGCTHCQQLERTLLWKHRLVLKGGAHAEQRRCERVVEPRDQQRLELVRNTWHLPHFLRGHPIDGFDDVVHTQLALCAAWRVGTNLDDRVVGIGHGDAELSHRVARHVDGHADGARALVYCGKRPLPDCRRGELVRSVRR